MYLYRVKQSNKILKNICISPFKNQNQYSPNVKTRVSELNDKISNIAAMGRKNYMYIRWDEDDVRFVLDQHA